MVPYNTIPTLWNCISTMTTTTCADGCHRTLTMEQSERYKRPSSSRLLRFADGTKSSSVREYDNLNLNKKHGQERHISRQQTPFHKSNSIRSQSSDELSATPLTHHHETNNTLDFSMIATPGGKRLARVVVNNEISDESSSHFTTPFTNMLRGVVSNTPGISSSSLVTRSAAITAQHNRSNKHINGIHAEEGVEEEEECTALTFAKSAPHSGYLKKLGKNIHTFKRRFFVLKPSTHLYYFMSPNDVEPRGCIDLDNVVEGSGGRGGGCRVNEIGVLPDGTFQFELIFDYDDDDGDAQDLNEDNDDTDALGAKNNNSNNTKNNSQSIVLEARTEGIGREWMAKIKSERLSVARGQVEQLQASLSKSEAACAQWEKFASDERRRANEAEVSRNVAIAEAKSWEARFRDLNEAIRLLVRVRDTALTTVQGDVGAESTSSLFLRESLQGLELNGTNFEDVSKAFQSICDDCNNAIKKKEYANESIIKLQQRLDEAEARASKTEADLAQVRDDAQATQNDLKRVKREKKILVKEVKMLHESRRQQEIENNDLKQRQLERGSTNAASSRSNDDQRRLIIELEEHVMSGLRLSEQFLTLNGIDLSEVGDDLDSSCLTGSKASDMSPLRRRRKIPAVIGAQSEVIGDDLDSIQASNKAIDMSPPRQIRRRENEPLESYLSPTNLCMPDTRQMSNLLDESSESEASSSIVPDDAAESEHGLTRLSDVFHVEVQSVAEKPVNQNLNNIFAEEPHNPKLEQATTPLTSQNDTINGTRSKITDNGHATTKLVKGPQDASSKTTSTDGIDGRVYHITFYRKRLGLQFQKVPNEMGSTTGLLTNVMMTADGLEAPETITTELQRIASMSQHVRNGGGDSEMEILPVSPIDAVIVCGFIGFDDASGSIRPKVGARLVAFDGIPVEVGRWTFESIRKAIQARGRPLTLSFRNDILSPKQETILKKALADIAAFSQPQTQSIPSNLQYSLPKSGSRGENPHSYLDDETLAGGASSASSTTSSQRSHFRKFYSFSETGSSVSSAVAPLVSNLMKKSKNKQQHQTKFAEPEYLRRQSSSHDEMRLNEFRSSML